MQIHMVARRPNGCGTRLKARRRNEIPDSSGKTTLSIFENRLIHELRARHQCPYHCRLTRSTLPVRAGEIDPRNNLQFLHRHDHFDQRAMP